MFAGVCLFAAVVGGPTVRAAVDDGDVPSRALRAIDQAIARYETLVGKIDDPRVAATARDFLASYRDRRNALAQSFDPAKHDELRFDLNVESHRLAQWLAPARTPPSGAPSTAARHVPDLNVTLVPIPAGTFTMGRSPPPGRPAGDEAPVTRVTISRPFWLGVTEITVGQWRRFVEATGYETEAERGQGMFLWKGAAPRTPATAPVAASVANTAHAGADPRFEKRLELNWRLPGHAQTDDHPVVGISWSDAQAFCRWLTARERGAGRLPAGYVYTLPTAAQWEYACTAGGAASETNEDDVAWFATNSGGYAHPVARKKANPWGLHDMQGNVWEWCLDWYGRYPGGSVTDPLGAATDVVRENRGGGWNSAGGHGISPTNRWNSPGLDRRDNLGFRIALSRSEEMPANPRE